MLQTADKNPLESLGTMEDFSGRVLERSRAKVRGNGLAKGERPQPEQNGQGSPKADTRIIRKWCLLSYHLAGGTISGFQPSYIPLAEYPCVAGGVLQEQTLVRTNTEPQFRVHEV